MTEVAVIGVKLYLELVRQVIKTFGVVVTVTVLVPETFAVRKYNPEISPPFDTTANSRYVSQNTHPSRHTTSLHAHPGVTACWEPV